MQILKDKVAIITGGASPRGLGKATAKMTAAHGAKIAILDLDAAAAQAAADDIGAGNIGLSCNVVSKDDCNAAVAQVLAHFGQVDILVNNAGITQPLKMMEIEPQNYDAVLDVNSARHLVHEPSVDPPHARPQDRVDYQYFLCLGPTRRWHFWWSTLFGGQGGYFGPDQSHGAGIGARWGSLQRDLPRLYRDRYHGR